MALYIGWRETKENFSIFWDRKMSLFVTFSANWKYFSSSFEQRTIHQTMSNENSTLFTFMWKGPSDQTISPASCYWLLLCPVTAASFPKFISGTIKSWQRNWHSIILKGREGAGERGRTLVKEITVINAMQLRSTIERKLDLQLVQYANLPEEFYIKPHVKFRIIGYWKMPLQFSIPLWVNEWKCDRADLSLGSQT